MRSMLKEGTTYEGINPVLQVFYSETGTYRIFALQK